MDRATDIAKADTHMHSSGCGQGEYVAVARYGINATGRDFVVGDIHGMFSALEELLAVVDFDGDRDRLFSVGDLVDRGPLSKDAPDWLEKPWFNACRGNHEQFALDTGDPEQFELWINHNGGHWWLDIEAEDQARCIKLFAQMPVAIEVETNAGKVGIVHADVPSEHSWESFMELLESGHKGAIFFAMWSRKRIANVNNAKPVAGQIVRIYCGHTPTRGVIKVHNVHYIDTGAVYFAEGYAEARLTMVEIQPTPHQEFTIYTGESECCS